MNVVSSEPTTRQVKVLFHASKWGFGPYEIVEDPETKMMASLGRGRRHRSDEKQQNLNQDDSFITDLNTFSPQLMGVVSEQDWLEKMTHLESVLADHTGPKLPFLIAIAYWVSGIAIDIIYGWYGFFMIVLPAVSYFVSDWYVSAHYKSRVEHVFQSWSPQVTAIFTRNVRKGEYALLELRLSPLSLASAVSIEYGGSMESEHNVKKSVEPPV